MLEGIIAFLRAPENVIPTKHDSTQISHPPHTRTHHNIGDYSVRANTNEIRNNGCVLVNVCMLKKTNA